MRFLELADADLRSDAVLQEVMLWPIDLRQALGETIGFARPDGEDTVHVVRLPSMRASCGTTITGCRLPALNTTSGRAMIGCFPRGEREAVSNRRLRSFTPPNARRNRFHG